MLWVRSIVRRLGSVLGRSSLFRHPPFTALVSRLSWCNQTYPCQFDEVNWKHFITKIIMKISSLGKFKSIVSSLVRLNLEINCVIKHESWLRASALRVSASTDVPFHRIFFFRHNILMTHLPPVEMIIKKKKSGVTCKLIRFFVSRF